MNIPIPSFLRRVLKHHNPKFEAPSGPMTQVELPFDQPAPTRGPAFEEKVEKIRLNLAEPDSTRLLSILEEAFADAPMELTIELTGPGILLHDNALMLFEEIRNRPSCIQLHVRARTCLVDGAVLLWLAGDTRSMRSDGWIQISAVDEPSRSSQVETSGAPLLIEEEEPANTDLRTIHRHINEWLPIREISGLRLFEDELREFGLLDGSECTRELSALFHGEVSTTEECTHRDLRDSASRMKGRPVR